MIMGRIFHALVACLQKQFATEAGYAPRRRTEAEVDALLNARVELHEKKKHEHLDPFDSIVDLMKALEHDSSVESRKELWAEFGQAGNYAGTADQNRTLVKEYRKQLVLGDFDL